MNALYFGDSFDPWRNLAAEEIMFDEPDDAMTLYLWQNANTVVVGRNQNAWRECRAALLEQEGGRLARRTTGGGAVYHDLGNLNFSFACKREAYDLARQTSVILEAVRALGVDAMFSGRNDLVTSDGAKFSGNAFRFTKHSALQHGTLLVNVEMDRLARYLAPSPEKLRSKGVESVRARVKNLSEYGPHITVKSVRDAVANAFFGEYGAYEVRAVEEFDAQKLARLYERNASWEWRMGATPQFDASLETRFAWGALEVQLSVENGRVARAAVYSDAMDEAFIRKLAPALAGARLEGSALAERIQKIGCENLEIAADITAWLSSKTF
ncbi:MAG TPA: lipoate--protein ligase [Clostridia bacterium]|nr:lipoate--protein ligase [Clostridia bacterium]HPK14383.1 lipoate--protein ligase [Clostridia bacterium]